MQVNFEIDASYAIDAKLLLTSLKRKKKLNVKKTGDNINFKVNTLTPIKTRLTRGCAHCVLTTPSTRVTSLRRVNAKPLRGRQGEH
ncbi:hypothetical protein [Candidatus Fukatsuia symbiotica]|uniref:hypothetical protein n=1 Tax=Candidatus Fukatsuia symbiotica TaxID=1878942 RepID=UPI0019676EF9|nr:hypothetical protein [Candidatus Fukatsuia symbiotica]